MIKYLAQGHKAGKWQKFKPTLSVSRIHSVTTMLYCFADIR